MARLSTIERLNDVLAAATRWKECCLLSNGSIFSEAEIGTPQNIDLLDKYFVQNPIEGKSSFIEKLGIQLKPSEPAIKQLAAEMIWALLLFPTNISGNKKRESVLQVWSWSGVPIDSDHPMLKVLDYGVGSGGIAYFIKRPYELAFLTELMQATKTEGSPATALLSSNPWKFGNWVDNLPSTGKRQFRHMMLYMLFPDEYERVSSTSEKQKIVQAFPQFLSSYAERPDDSASVSVDRKLLVVRKGLERQYRNQEIDFYEPPVKPLWNPNKH
jgi:5-methylcytosine-specific restriction protein B